MLMQERFQNHPEEVSQITSAELRKAFVITDLLQIGKIQAVYSHYDRLVIGGVVPSIEKISLPSYTQLKTDYFLQRREMAIINIGGEGIINVNGTAYSLDNLDCLNIGMGSKEITFTSENPKQLAQFYFLSEDCFFLCH